jgi:hypothetical protein
MDAPLAQYANEAGSLVHPEPGRVFACTHCDAAPPRYAASTAACWCPDCGASLAPDEIIVRDALTNLRGLDPAGKLLWAAPAETPISALERFREQFGDGLRADGGDPWPPCEQCGAGPVAAYDADSEAYVCEACADEPQLVTDGGSLVGDHDWWYCPGCGAEYRSEHARDCCAAGHADGGEP